MCDSDEGRADILTADSLSTGNSFPRDILLSTSIPSSSSSSSLVKMMLGVLLVPWYSSVCSPGGGGGGRTCRTVCVVKTNHINNEGLVLSL